MIAPCAESDFASVNAIINEAARIYEGVIPADRWHDPYMPMDEMRAEIASGVLFYGYARDGNLVAVMGMQNVQDVTLVRHAYVLTKFQGQGLGRHLLEHLKTLSTRPILIGAWKAATWAIAFYEKNGFRLVGEEEKDRLLKTYWSVSQRQIEESVVLTNQS